MMMINNLNEASIMTISNINIPYEGYDMISGFNKNTNKIWVFGGLSNRTSTYHHYNEAITYDINNNNINIENVNNPPIYYLGYGSYSCQINNSIYWLYPYGLSSVGMYKFDMNTATYYNVIEADNKFPFAQLSLCNNEEEYPNIIFGFDSHNKFNYFGYYNFSNNLWLNASNNTLINSFHYMGSCVILNGYFYAIGGTSNIIDKISVNAIFGNEIMSIQSYAILPDANNAEATIETYLNQYIIIIGGYHNAKFNISFSKSITIYDTINNYIWTDNDALPLGLSRISSVLITVNDDRLFLFGGYDNETSSDFIIYGNMFDL